MPICPFYREQQVVPAERRSSRRDGGASEPAIPLAPWCAHLYSPVSRYVATRTLGGLSKLRCGGELWLVSVSAETMQLGEVILYGQDRCNGRALLTIGRDKDDGMTMQWRDVTGAGTGQGTLKKRSE